MRAKEKEFSLKGVPVCCGVAIGRPFFFALKEDDIPEFLIPAKEINEEILRYRKAVASSCEEIKRLQKRLKKERILEGASILDAHLHMMKDPLLTTRVEEEIRSSKKNAEYVFDAIIKQYQKKFQSLADPFFRERFKDIQDISRRVMGYLKKSVRVSLAEIPPGSIVFANELTASDTAEAEVSSVSAFVTAQGGATSHAAIVAKAKGIPYVTGVAIDEIREKGGKGLAVVDGRTGEVVIHPSEEMTARYQLLKENLDKAYSLLVKEHSLPAETLDGHGVVLSANIDMVEDIDLLHKHGGKRVGLFRSENMFLANESFPSEEEQFQIYQKLVKKMKGLPIVIRTFDFGGDKLMLNRSFPFEGNPYFGFRAIRSLLKEKDIFQAQLRAILRASVGGDVSIMFPMISTLSELIEAKQFLHEACRELEKRGCPFVESLQVGSMIEVPSAAIVADLIAKECDFLSIGTNDLTQYALAVDRRSHSLHSLGASADPSVLRMIQQIVSQAKVQGISVAICGEIAADPRFTALLLGLGVHEFSVAPRYIPLIKQTIRALKMKEATHLAEKVLSLSHAHEILELIQVEHLRSIPKDDPSYQYQIL